jgi:MHS family proline/betaine transporter-like MFS transporter
MAAVIGNFVEWYDFAIYGYFATVIATLFFPSESRLASLLATFAVFGVAFMVRPLGALFFGSIGDRVGRRNTLSVVILLMSGATFLIGLAPTYAQVGVLAPLLLVVARVAQGFSVGGEFGGATAFMIEYAPEGRRGLYGSWQAFTQGVSLIVGVLLGVFLTSALPEDVLYSWGWRVPFLLALPLGLVGLYLRLRLEDTPAFRVVRETAEVEQAPLRQTVRSHGGDLLRVVGIILILTALTYLFIFLPTYLSETVGLPLSLAFVANIVGLSAFLVVCYASGTLSDRLGRKPFLIASPLLGGIFVFPGFLLLQTGNFPAIVLAHVIFGVAVGLSGGAYPAAISELFPTKVRYSSLSIGYSVATSFFGGTTPFIFTALLGFTGNPIAPAFYVLGAAVISLIAALAFPETAKGRLRDA